MACPLAAPLLRRSLGPTWRQPRGKSTFFFVNSHTNATRIGWHLWEIDLRFAPGLPPGWGAAFTAAVSGVTRRPLFQKVDGRRRCQANMAHIRQTRPVSGLGFQVNIRKNLLSCSLFARTRTQKHRNRWGKLLDGASTRPSATTGTPTRAR